MTARGGSTARLHRLPASLATSSLAFLRPLLLPLLLPHSPPPLSPLLLAVLQALRDLVPAVRAFVTKHRVGLSLFSTLNLALIVWQVLSGAQSIRERRWRLPAPPQRHAALSSSTQHCGAWLVGRARAAADPALAAALAALAVMDQPFVDLVYVFLLSAGQHVVYLAFNFTVTT